MRRIVIATLVLIPVLANAQASTSTKPSQNSATLVAAANPPAALTSSNNSASSVDVATSAVPMSVVIHQATPVADADASGTIFYSFGTDQSASSTTVPQLIHVVNPDLAPQQLVEGSDVTVHLTVDRNGVPQNITVDHATDPIIARKTIAAISQYRFKPAMRNLLAVPADVTVDVKIKQ